MKGLMEEGMQPEQEVEEKETEGSNKQKEVDSELVYQLALKLLTSPEGSQMVAQVMQGASDQAQAIAKVAGMVITRVQDELATRGMPVSDDSVFDEGGSLVKVLTAIYQAAAEAGVEVSMEDTIIQAYEIAEADLETMLDAQEQSYGA